MKMNTLSEEVRARVLADGRTISEIARAAGLNQPTLHRYVTGQRELTSELLGKLLPVIGGEIRWKKSPKK